MISKFHLMTIPGRREALVRTGTPQNVLSELTGGMDAVDPMLDRMSENVIGAWQMPLGVLTGIIVDGAEHRAAMATEEPSVVAAANYAARLFNRCGGVRTSVSEPVTTAQIMIGIDPAHAESFCRAVSSSAKRWLDIADRCDPALIAAGGGALDFSARPLPCAESEAEQIVAAELRVHTCEAMGANAVNTMAEAILNIWCREYGSLPGFERGMAIVSNDAAGRLVHAEIELLPAEIEDAVHMPADRFGAAMARASRFAMADPRRAVTHNKGILNGIIAASVPFGQDTRAISAAAFHHACRSGIHRPLSQWRADSGALIGMADIPIPCGFIGSFRHYAPSDAAFRFADIHSCSALASLLAAVGLAQNFAALRALVTDGIQAGHMALHHKKDKI